ncbi:HAMP domain-containing sensor histidine kinase [Aequorivita sp. SDUM287046]|uniref:histidine kinase n=1 Tax=Aequorivita aurantiaca TaxID=3053356 RepID=A0ABT8DCR8_9FLAO|nr:HAMP domain-containing sensor histidine kinase [Aequorivita aurantiaca]MDN3722942.1 HAMP domain-containing sensor histidine kinase [Aequorivita aurantiaca]
MTLEKNLKERIKELTCLYEVSSIIVNNDYRALDKTLYSIALSLRKSLQYSKFATVEISADPYHLISSTISKKTVLIEDDINVFNEPKGFIKIHYPADKFSKKDFLPEEKKLLKNVAINVGDLLERAAIRENEVVMKRKMEHADRLSILGEITAGIAHELNTPLANILGFAELLKNKETTNTQNSQDLDKIINSAIFSREVVKKLMFFACEMPQNLGQTDIVPVINDALNLLDPTFKKNEINYKANLPKVPVLMKADTIQLTQVIFNLVLNAIYFSPKNGTIKITLEETKKKIILKIADEGPGISAENVQKIFQPFFTTKTVGDGSGLGLSVVHGIIRSHRGTIEYQSNNPTGAIFIITFPKQ